MHAITDRARSTCSFNFNITPARQDRIVDSSGLSAEGTLIFALLTPRAGIEEEE